MDLAERRRLTEQSEQARRDLAELNGQEEAGEIDGETARRLRATYLREFDAAETALAEPAEQPSEGEATARSPARVAIGAAVLVGAMALTIGIVGSFTQERASGPLEGVATGDPVDLADVSNEAMEAVIAANRDDPAFATQIPQMEFALAERYFEEQDYQNAFDHYRSVVENPSTPTDTFTPALVRVAWIVWVTTPEETELALSTVNRAIELSPGFTEALYVKAQILWCGSSRPDEAVELFDRILASPDLPPEVTDQVTADLELARAGEACR